MSGRRESFDTRLQQRGDLGAVVGGTGKDGGGHERRDTHDQRCRIDRTSSRRPCPWHPRAEPSKRARCRTVEREHPPMARRVRIASDTSGRVKDYHGGVERTLGVDAGNAAAVDAGAR